MGDHADEQPRHRRAVLSRGRLQGSGPAHLHLLRSGQGLAARHRPLQAGPGDRAAEGLRPQSELLGRQDRFQTAAQDAARHLPAQPGRHAGRPEADQQRDRHVQDRPGPDVEDRIRTESEGHHLQRSGGAVRLPGLVPDLARLQQQRRAVRQAGDASGDQLRHRSHQAGQPGRSGRRRRRLPPVHAVRVVPAVRRRHQAAEAKVRTRRHRPPGQSDRPDGQARLQEGRRRHVGRSRPAPSWT